MNDDCIVIESVGPLHGQASLVGAKNAVLVTMAATLLTEGVSTLTNVPVSADVTYMIALLESMGAHVAFDVIRRTLTIDTTTVNRFEVSPDLMKKMRASILVMGPLLARFGRARVVLPGGCTIGARPIDFHIKNFKKIGVQFTQIDDLLHAQTTGLQATRIALEYPSVGATENILLAATLCQGVTTIVNAAIEPEVFDLVTVLRAMGANIAIQAPATIVITGVSSLRPFTHDVMVDRLEVGALLLAGAISGGSVEVVNARAEDMDVFLMKLQEMGHRIDIGVNGIGVRVTATPLPEAVSFKTSPYPGFPTDLQAPMMAAQCIANGICEISETVFENRFLHVRELQKMGAQIKYVCGDKVQIKGVTALYGMPVIASDIRASCALVLAGLVAKGKTVMTGMNHWRRGYDKLEDKFTALGARVSIEKGAHVMNPIDRLTTSITD